jgi:hypothetical protein
MKTLTFNPSKEVIENIKKLNYYSLEQFQQDAQTYIKAIKEGRMLCVIKSVSKSGMSRVIKFNSAEHGKERTNFRQYSCLFETLGYKESRSQSGYTVNGCGMDMIFHTNYSIIHSFKNMGIITKEEADKLAQQTPVLL